MSPSFHTFPLSLQSLLKYLMYEQMLEHQMASCLASALSLLLNKLPVFIWSNIVLSLPCSLVWCWQKLLGEAPKKIPLRVAAQLGSIFFLTGYWTYKWSPSSHFAL